MSLFFWKDNKKIDLFASALADTLYSHVQPTEASAYFKATGNAAEQGRERKRNKEQSRIFNYLIDVIKEVRKFREENKLGIYGKARLQLSFQERLRDLGYEEATISEITKMILLGAV